MRLLYESQTKHIHSHHPKDENSHAGFLNNNEYSEVPHSGSFLFNTYHIILIQYADTCHSGKGQKTKQSP